MNIETGLPSFVAGTNFIRRADWMAAAVKPPGKLLTTRMFSTVPYAVKTERRMTVPVMPADLASLVYDGSGFESTRTLVVTSLEE